MKWRLMTWSLTLALALCGPRPAAPAEDWTSARGTRSAGEIGMPAAEVPVRSALALEQLAPTERPELVLAQRTIEREWTVPGDPGMVHLAAERSEIAALALSAAAPGAGQLYLGERRGAIFAAAEAVGWLGWWLFRRDSDDLRSDARGIAGSPEDSASAWSFERWADATQQDTQALRLLYAADQEAFFDAIAANPQYLAGWDDPQARDRFDDLRQRSDRSLRHARGFQIGVWFNHVIAAADALRSARMHNLPLRRDLKIRMRGGLERGRPGFLVCVERRF